MLTVQFQTGGDRSYIVLGFLGNTGVMVYGIHQNEKDADLHSLMLTKEAEKEASGWSFQVLSGCGTRTVYNYATREKAAK